MGDNTVKSYIVKIYLTDINGNPKLYELFKINPTLGNIPQESPSVELT